MKKTLLYLSSLSLILNVSCHKEADVFGAKAGIVAVDSATATIAVSIYYSGDETMKDRGLAWDLNPNPHTGNYSKSAASSTDTFTITMDYLEDNTTYYARPYLLAGSQYLYGDQISFTTDTIPYSTIGTPGPAGGIIFYVDGNGGGMEVYDTSLTTVYWGCSGDYIVGTGSAFGTGQANTDSIINQCGDTGNAAEIADSFEINGFSDWYLPSRNELFLVYNELYSGGYLTAPSYIYWTSTQYSAQQAYGVNFSDGNEILIGKNSATRYVIPVRTF